MSTIYKTFKVNGVKADMTSVVLEDPTGTYGVKRNDTDATVVAAATALTKAATGEYYHTFTDPANDLTYTYWLKFVYAGNTRYIEGTLTGPATPAISGSYVTLAEAAGYAAEELDSTVWDALSDAARTAALVRATADLDVTRWQGRKYDADQARQFPRMVDELPDTSDAAGTVGVGIASGTVRDWDDDAGEAVVPEAVKRATYLQAVSIAVGDREARQDDIHDGLTGQSAAGMSEQYGPAARANGRHLCRRAYDLVRPYLLRTGRIV